MSDTEVERVPQMIAGRDADQRAERIELTRPSLVRAVAIVGAVVIAAALVVAMSTVVWWLLIAAVLGAMVHPAASFLKRRMPAGLALTLIVVAVLGVAGWLGFRGLAEVKDQTESVRANVVATAEEIAASPDYGDTARRIGLADKVNAALDGVPGSGNEVAAPLQLVTSSGGALFSIAMLSLLFVIFWPQLFAGALRQTADVVRRERVTAHLRRSYRACVRYAWLMLARAVVVGFVTGMVATGLGVGAPTLIGLWFAACSLIPGVGFVVAVVPLTLLATIGSPGQAAVLLLAAVAAQAVDGALIQPRVDRSSVHLGPAVTLLAIMLGLELYGIGGVIVLVAASALALAFLDSLTAHRRDLTEAVKDLSISDDDTVTAHQTTAAVNDRDGSVTWWYELGWRTPLLGALAVVGLMFLIAVVLAGPAVALAGTALLLSFGFDPFITRFTRWSRIPRGFVVGLFFCTVTAVAIAGVVAFLPSTVDQASTVQQDLPRAIDELTELPLIGPVLADNQAPDRIREWAGQLPAQVASDPTGVAETASTVGTAVLAAFVVGFLLIGLLIDGPRLVDALKVAMPQPRVPVLSRAGELTAKTAGRYFSGSLVLAGLQATQVLVTGLALGVPLSPALAVWAGIWTLVPQIGGAIGGLPFILLAFTQSASTGLIATAVFGLYLVIANNVLLPVIVGKAIDASALATMAATIAGFTLLGVIGAVLAVPVFGATKSIYLALRPPEPSGLPERRHPPGRVRTRTAQIRDRSAGPSVAVAGSAVRSS